MIAKFQSLKDDPSDRAFMSAVGAQQRAASMEATEERGIGLLIRQLRASDAEVGALMDFLDGTVTVYSHPEDPGLQLRFMKDREPLAFVLCRCRPGHRPIELVTTDSVRQGIKFCHMIGEESD